MSDLLLRGEPIELAAFTADGVTIALASPMARYSLRARERSALEKMIGVALPEKIGTTEVSAVCLGPDEWLVRMPLGALLAPGDGIAVSVTEVSERSICIAVTGPHAAQVIAAGCPLDLDKFAVGRATRTIFETVEIILLRTGDERFEVEVWRSFAPWLRSAFEAAATQLR